MFVKCSCQNCNNHIEFDAAYAGQHIKCPHCFELTELIIPKIPFISEQTLQNNNSPLPEITVNYDRNAVDKMTVVVIENRGNRPSCGIRGVQVEINHIKKTLTFRRVDVGLGVEIPPIENVRRNRVNFTKYKIPDGIYLYRRAIKDNYRENDLKVIRLKEGVLTLVWEDEFLWDYKGRMEQYYLEYFGSYTFIYTGNEHWGDRVYPRYITPFPSRR